MPLKRSFQVESKYTRPFKRTKYASLSRAIAVRKPELKETYFRVNGAVPAGTLKYVLLWTTRGLTSTNRVGDSIRIMSIDVMGYPCGTSGDNNAVPAALLIRPKNGEIPLPAHFTAGLGTFYDYNRGWTLDTFTPQSSDSGGGQGCAAGEFGWKYKTGMVQETSDDVVVKNAVYFVLNNNTASEILGVDATIRMRYYDV